MIKAVILFNIILSVFPRIKHCDEVVPVCQKCINGYKMLIDKNIDYRVCQQEDSIDIEIEHCTSLDYTDRTKCSQCEMGYAVTKGGNECKENSEHCDVLDGDVCVKCEHYFKLNDDNKCEKSTCYSFDEDNNCICIDGFYKNDKNACSRIPIKYCYKGNSTFCESCYGGYLYKAETNECVINKEELEPDYEDETIKNNIEHCLEIDEDDNTVCEYCDYNYEWDSISKTCKSICAGSVEELCDECFNNYHSYDYGKTCEKMDLEYDGDDGEDDENDSNKDGNNSDKQGNGSDKVGESDDGSKFINFDFTIIGFILCLSL